MPNHILRYPHIVVDFAVVDLEDEADEVGEDGGASGLGFDGWASLAGFGADDWKTGWVLVGGLGEGWSVWGWCTGRCEGLWWRC